MKNRIVFFSGGNSSFAVADFVKTSFPNDNIVLYFTDTNVENYDLYRFIYEVSDKLKLPMLIHSTGLTPLQLMFEKKMVYNNRIGDCSKYLKMKVASDFLKKGIKPNYEKWYNHEYLKDDNFVTDATLYWGIDFMEMHRAEPITKNWKPFESSFPLIDNFIDHHEVLDRHSIKECFLYSIGASHNNCNMKCVKAGMSHYKLFAQKMPEEFQKHVEEEHYLKLYVSSYRYIKDIESDGRDGWDEDVRQQLFHELDDAYRDYFYGRAKKPKIYVHPCATATVEYKEKKHYCFVYNKNEQSIRRKVFRTYLKPSTEHMFIKQYAFMKRNGKPYPLTQFVKDLRVNPQKIDPHSHGGCGCFTDYSSTMTSNENEQLTLAI
ncbi:phosphoadenosine phosphosulfate reductase family protein [Cytobacillus praedii]|uniref:phosphoadenosine phosphosulfate reductase domain-containing protein n=1 Tax=Cytobacillus praedii TaxID=1742358 RepID=UPI002E214249|nr:phosphoadenosine phosphosulfate reductase family protein [Cytobacillus praedii]MED3576026.1 hypothetical protein [Cytobacillus praedii]